MTIHVVQSGDSLWGISKKYGIPINTILETNGLQTPTSLVPGLALYIPQTTLPLRYYQIARGDTLRMLAARFNTTIDNILTANPTIQPNQLFIGQRIVIPSPIKLAITTLGFITPYSPTAFLPTLEQLSNKITYLAIVSYSFTEEGYAYVLLEDSAIVTRSNQIGIKPLLMIRNFQNDVFSPELIGRVLENPTYRQNLIRSLLNFVLEKGYGGVSIDFEFIPPPRRRDFITFLTELKQALGSLILHVNVHAKTEDLPTNRIVGAYDYRAIGQVVDIMAVMTIDYGYPTGPPNPISPIWWVNQVVRYSVGLVNPNKLQIAFALYGYDWKVQDFQTSALSVLSAQNFTISAGSPIFFDSVAAAPWFRYWKGTEEHIVWFEDIRSYTEKYKLLDIYQLLGTTYWQLSLPFPQNWAFMEQNITVLK